MTASDVHESGFSMATAQIVRRIGTTPAQRGSLALSNCPDIFLLTDGDFAVIGTDRTEEIELVLPADASRADYERIVVITRETLMSAIPDLLTLEASAGPAQRSRAAGAARPHQPVFPLGHMPGA
jgi:hypothetical protein